MLSAGRADRDALSVEASQAGSELAQAIRAEKPDLPINNRGNSRPSPFASSAKPVAIKFMSMGRTTTLPKRFQPMLATLTDAPFDDAGWIFEDKYDGFRMVAEIKGGKVTLYSRNGKIISNSYVEVAKALEGIKGDAVIIDGELVALDENGVSGRFIHALLDPAGGIAAE